MEEEFRNQDLLGSFHRTDAQSRQETLPPLNQFPKTWALSFTAELPREWREAAMMQGLPWCL